MKKINSDKISKTIAIGCDHAGVDFKTDIINWLGDNGYTVIDCGCGRGESVDYPDKALEVCQKIISENAIFGVLICGTGIGISMSANKISGIRAALCHDCFSAKYTRLHNDANVICFGARVIGTGLATELLDIFLNNDFEGGRHKRRVDKIMSLEG